jgi:hypothetical protein
MQGRARMERELLDAESMVGQLVPEGSVFAFLAEHRREVFPDSFMADLFASRTGRPLLPADLVGSVLVLKELYDLSDPQTAEAVRFDLRWKVACGRSLTVTRSTRPRWCTGANGSRNRSAGIGCLTRWPRWSPKPGCCAGGAGAVWIRRCSTTRWPPGTR